MEQVKAHLGISKSQDDSPAKRVEPARALADQIRGKGGVESHIAVLSTQVSEADRVEFFRAKDFSAWIEAHPDKVIPGVCLPGTNPAEQAQAMMQLLLRKGLVRAVDRLFKSPKPGRKRLVKWPKKLTALPANDQLKWSEDGFYYYTYELPTSPWLFVGAVASAVAVLLICLFPLAPYQIKIAVVYISATLLILLFGAIFVRAVVAGITWSCAGRCVWLLPNMLSDTVGLDEAFWPLIEIEEVDESWIWYSSHLQWRLAFAATVATVIYGLLQVGPGKGDLTSGARATHDQVLEWLNLQEAQYKQLGEASNETDLVLDQQGASMQQNPMSKTDVRTAQGIAHMARMRAAAEAAAQPVQDEVLLTFEEIIAGEAKEAGEAAAAAAAANGASEAEIAAAEEAASAAFLARVAQQDAQAAPDVQDLHGDTGSPDGASGPSDEL